MDEDDDINNNYDAEDSNNSDDDDNNLSSSLNESSLKQSKKINIETSSDANGEFHHVDGEGAQGAQPDDSLNKSSTKKGKHSKKKKGKGKKELPGLNEPGGVTAVVNKLLNKRGGGNKGAELKLEDLDENVLKDRLQHLEAELEDYRAKCQRYKSENEWYRNEIETCKKESVDYIAFLESKKNEKSTIINDLMDRCKQETDAFLEGKRKRESENKEKMEELKKLIEELEMKLEAKQTEIMHLSDIMVRRVRHEAEISKIKKEMQAAEDVHRDKVSELERKLLESRMKLQREADAKVREMENAAHEKAAKYVKGHTNALEKENRQLELELRKLVLVTEDQLVRKEWLERTNRELQRELQVREDLIKMRLERVGNAHKKVEDERQAKRQAKSEKKRLDMINMMENLGIVESRVATSLRELVSSTTAAGSDKKDAGQGKVSLLPSVGNNNKSGHGVKLQIATSSTTTHAMATTWVSNKTVGVYQQAPSADRIGGIVVGRSSVALADSIQKTSRGSASSAPLKHKFVVDGIDLRELLLMKDEDEFFSDLDDD